MPIQLIFAIVAFFTLNCVLFSYISKISNGKKGNLWRYILCSIFNATLLLVLLLANIHSSIFLTIEILLFCVELIVIFKLPIRQAIFIDTVMYMHVLSLYLSCFIVIAHRENSSIALVRANDILFYELLTIVFFGTTIIGILVRNVFNPRRQALSNKKYLSEMVSIICIAIIIYTIFDMLTFIDVTMDSDIRNILAYSAVIHYLLFYQLISFATKISDIHIDKKSLNSLKVILDDLREKELELTNKISIDGLTGLYTRGFILPVLDDLCDNFQDTFAVFFTDINGLKKTNDTLGHIVGDELIRYIAVATTESFRGTDLVARISGDEFLIVCKNMNAMSAEKTLIRLKDNIEKFNVSEARFHVSASAGYILVDREIAQKGTNAIIAYADSQMRLNKKQFYEGGNIL